MSRTSGEDRLYKDCRGLEISSTFPRVRRRYISRKQKNLPTYENHIPIDRHVSFSLAFITATQAQVTLAGIRADGMVLQREMAVPVWGGGDPEEAFFAGVCRPKARSGLTCSGPLRLVELATVYSLQYRRPASLSVQDRPFGALGADLGLPPEIYLRIRRSKGCIKRQRSYSLHDSEYYFVRSAFRLFPGQSGP